MPVDVLAIAAHSDDIELTCAGTLVTLKARGRRFGIVDLTRGEMGTRGDAATREREARRGAEVLGAEFREILDFGDGGLRKTRENELAAIEARARYFGFMIGVEFGEGFVSKRPPRIDDPISAFEGFEPGF